jgi:excisionase family DNA binding protein
MNRHHSADPASPAAPSDASRAEGVGLVLPAAAVEVIAERVAEILADRFQQSAVPEYLTVSEAADLLSASRQRIYDLLSSRRLTRLKDGRRVLVLRSEIEAHLRGTAQCAVAPALPPAPESRMNTRRAA